LRRIGLGDRKEIKEENPKKCNIMQLRNFPTLHLCWLLLGPVGYGECGEGGTYSSCASPM